MKTEKPIVCFDVETTEIPGSTGQNPADHRIVQIALGRVNALEPESNPVQVQYINPGIPISKRSQEIHHITDEMVANAPKFADCCKSILSAIEGCDLLGYNCKHFDMVVLVEEFIRAGVEWDWTRHRVIDAFNIFRKKEPRDLAAAVKFYCCRSQTKAHDASGDVLDTADVFLAMIRQYEDIGQMDVNALAKFSSMNDSIDPAGKFARNEQGQVIFTFGKNAGQPVSTNMGMVRWCLDKDFPESTKRVCRMILSGKLV